MDTWTSIVLKGSKVQQEIHNIKDQVIGNVVRP